MRGLREAPLRSVAGKQMLQRAACPATSNSFKRTWVLADGTPALRCLVHSSSRAHLWKHSRAKAPGFSVFITLLQFDLLSPHASSRPYPFKVRLVSSSEALHPEDCGVSGLVLERHAPNASPNFRSECRLQEEKRWPRFCFTCPQALHAASAWQAGQLDVMSVSVPFQKQLGSAENPM